MKKLWLVYVLLIGIFIVYVLNYKLQAQSTEPWDTTGLRGNIEDTYVMVTFQSGIDYWKSVLKGFEDGAEELNVSVEYHGSTQHDANEQMTVLEQVIAKKPAGIAISAVNSKLLTATINKAVESGIPVVLFDSGAPDSKAYSFLGTDNYNAGIEAARTMAELTDAKGAVAIVTTLDQHNHQERTDGFRDTITSEYPQMTVVALEDGRGDQVYSRQAAEWVLSQYPDLAGIFATESNGGIGVAEAVEAYKGKGSSPRIISFDTDKGTLDLVKEGTISATMAQGTWNMGYWSLMELFQLHRGLADEPSAYSHNELLPVPDKVDTGIDVVTRANVDQYYAQ
ncbi:substrate-binding domain-containing protein [Paenibacillus crassostreae]|uniref:LacI family transcriptional regulator n=1 Tax=Paenibacillus crassostreae TaxID=1763538 RepID=A0A167ASI3_9BACL|nr:substrate-binding domain-containing protein [Paenibacillus crassostreae]AOZ93686.1 LacI family transcriptional regulator [Paenibacillus crassostreae]OAB71380.1 LacI family transcriptional regulator [Paenibacillus crassostreae]